MGASQHIKVGHFVAVNSEFDFCDFLEGIEDDDSYTNIEDIFCQAGDFEIDGKIFIIPNRNFENFKDIDPDDSSTVLYINKKPKWDERWNILFVELKKAKIKFSKNYGVLTYIY